MIFIYFNLLKFHFTTYVSPLVRIWRYTQIRTYKYTTFKSCDTDIQIIYERDGIPFPTFLTNKCAHVENNSVVIKSLHTRITYFCLIVFNVYDVSFDRVCIEL